MSTNPSPPPPPADETEGRYCKDCRHTLPVSEFYSTWCVCKACEKARKRRVRDANRGVLNQQLSKDNSSREWARRNPDKVRDAYRRYAARYPERRRAYARVRHALDAGRLQKPNRCESCGAEALLSGHHEDYSRPLDVRWLCRRCHHRADKEKSDGRTDNAA